MLRQVDDALAGHASDPTFPQSVWDTWNAKAPRDQVVDALPADRALIERFESIAEPDARRLVIALGPLQVGLDELVVMRLNEHVLHTWDVAVAFDPVARLAPTAVPIVVDNLAMIARFAVRPEGRRRRFRIVTTDPARAFALELAGDTASLEPTADDADDATNDDVDLRLPAEAFIRLVYGRLDPDHTPNEIVATDDTMETLRDVYRGV